MAGEAQTICTEHESRVERGRINPTYVLSYQRLLTARLASLARPGFQRLTYDQRKRERASVMALQATLAHHHMSYDMYSRPPLERIGPELKKPWNDPQWTQARFKTDTKCAATIACVLLAA